MDHALDFALGGFTDSNVGVLSFILSRRFNLSEGVVRNVLGEGVIDVAHRFNRFDKEVIIRVIRRLTANTLERPTIDLLRRTIFDVDQALGLGIDPDKLNKVARFLYLDWDKLMAGEGALGIGIRDIIPPRDSSDPSEV